MAQPTEGEWRAVGNTAIYAGDKMIAMTAVKDISDFDERRANIELMAAAKDLLTALENCAECLNILAAKCLIQVEGAPLKSDSESYGSIDALNEARAAITKARKTELRNQQ